MTFFKNLIFLLLWELFRSNALVRADHVNLPKIIGGHDTKITEVPWQALHFRNGLWWAGGVIIGPREVLTAAHCFTEAGDAWQEYRVGSDQLNTGGKYYTVESYVIHPGFNVTNEGLYNDIAVARVAKPFEFSETVQPIKLAKQEPQAGDEVLISGFGIWKFDDPDNYELPPVLQSVVLPIVDRETCRAWYSDVTNKVTDDQICAGLFEGGYSTCHGDTGGPMVFNNELVGVASWDLCFDSSHHPSVYTSVAQYTDWIEEQLNSFK